MGEEEDDEVPRVQLSEEEKAAALARAMELENKSMPTPPVSVLVSSAAFTPKGADIFAEIAKSHKQ